MTRLVILLLALLCAFDAQAWGRQGHRLIGELAQPQLSPVASAEVQRLLKDEAVPTLAGVSSWADELRDSDPELGRRSSPWHYVNFRSGRCEYNPLTDCRNGDCIIAASQRYADILADRTRSDADRAQALKFLVHFIGDLHQPLHNSLRTDDKGGNDVQVRIAGQGSNLHSVWDTQMFRLRGLDDASYLSLLQTPVADADRPRRSFEEQSEASCSIIERDAIYPRKRKLGEDYVQRHRPTAEAQLRIAAAQLAAWLNHLLGESAPVSSKVRTRDAAPLIPATAP